MQSVVIARPQSEAIHITKYLKLFLKIISEKCISLSIYIIEVFMETKRLNEQVKRNIERFPENFMFQLTREEIEEYSSKSQIATLKIDVNSSVKSQFATSRSTDTLFSGQDGGTRKLPYAFTEQGVAMLSGVLKSETAVKMSIQIMNAFVSMRHFLQKIQRARYPRHLLSGPDF